jgi:hypothetical protein
MKNCMIKFVAIIVTQFYQTLWQQILCKGRKDFHMKRDFKFQILGSRFQAGCKQIPHTG